VASLRQVVTSDTPDSISTSNIRRVLRPSVVNLWVSTGIVTDSVSLFLDQTEIMAAGPANISDATLALIKTSDDQLVFNSVVGRGDLRIPTVVATAQGQLLSVEPILR